MVTLSPGYMTPKVAAVVSRAPVEKAVSLCVWALMWKVHRGTLERLGY